MQKMAHRCQSRDDVSINALKLFSSSMLLVGGNTFATEFDGWAGSTSGIAYKSFPNSSQSESSGCKKIL